MRTRHDILEEFDNLPHTNLTTREWLSQILEEVANGVPNSVPYEAVDRNGNPRWVTKSLAIDWRTKFLTPPASPEENK